MSLSIGKKRDQQAELAEANRLFRGKGKDDSVKDVVTENMETVTDSQPLAQKLFSEEDKFVHDHLNNLLAQGMEMMREEAQDALARDPNDEEAKTQLLHYAQWQRQRFNANPNGLMVSKASKGTDKKPSSGRNTGVFQRTKDYGWVVRVSGKNSKPIVGEWVDIRKKGGEVVTLMLIEEVAPRYFRVREV